MTTPLPHVEQIRDWRTPELHIDHDRRLVSNVALTGTVSRNGYRYSEDALRSAVPLYENKPVFLDHAVNLARPQERSARDLVGSIIQPRFADGRIRGDIQVLDTEAGRTFLALAETNSPAVGMSHVVLAQRSGDQTVVERIHDVVSVDAVVFPATTQGFRESQYSLRIAPLPGSLEALLAEIDARLPDHTRRLTESPAALVTRVGLLANTVICEIQHTEESPPELRALEWRFTEGRLELADHLTPITSDQLATAGVPFLEFSRVESLREQVVGLTTERDALRNQLDALRNEQRQRAEEQHLERLLSAAGLPEFAVSESFRAQLRAAANDEARRRLIQDRLALVNHCRQARPTSRERLPSEPPVETESFIAAIRRNRLARSP